MLSVFVEVLNDIPDAAKTGTIVTAPLPFAKRI